MAIKELLKQKAQQQRAVREQKQQHKKETDSTLSHVASAKSRLEARLRRLGLEDLVVGEGAMRKDDVVFFPLINAGINFGMDASVPIADDRLTIHLQVPNLGFGVCGESSQSRWIGLPLNVAIYAVILEHIETEAFMNERPIPSTPAQDMGRFIHDVAESLSRRYPDGEYMEDELFTTLSFAATRCLDMFTISSKALPEGSATVAQAMIQVAVDALTVYGNALRELEDGTDLSDCTFDRQESRRDES